MSAPANYEYSAHATALLVGETGVLIRGASGSGKSSLALALLAAAGSGGEHARLVGDDRLRLSIAHGRLVARAHPAIAGLIEQRGEGLVKAKLELAAVIRCVVDLVESDQSRDIPPRYPEEDAATLRLGELVLPRLTLPATLPASESARRVGDFVRRLCL
jgi:serine kinase of HPr protein (carbohydrate metabolism regulator)